MSIYWYGPGADGELLQITVSPPLSSGTYLTGGHLCPDMLRYEQIGTADGMRGRLVRGFFWLLRAWPVG